MESWIDCIRCLDAAGKTPHPLNIIEARKQVESLRRIHAKHTRAERLSEKKEKTCDQKI